MTGGSHVLSESNIGWFNYTWVDTGQADPRKPKASFGRIHTVVFAAGSDLLHHPPRDVLSSEPLIRGIARKDKGMRSVWL
jgi:hypothetical protein